MSHASLGAMFRSVCEKFPDRTAIMFKEGGAYQSLTKQEFKNRVYNFAAALQELGVQKGDRVLLLSENRLEWAISDYAILSLGAVTVPIYPSDTIQFKKIQKIRDKIPKIEHLISMDKTESDDVISWDKAIETGKSRLEEKPDAIDKEIEKVTREDLASIIYTSGTTGLPKGVMLTHGNFLSNVEGSLQSISVSHEDTFLSFLPLSHVFERMAGHFLAFYAGSTIAYAESIETVADNLREVRPTVMTSVPRFFEKIYGRLLESLEESSLIKKKIFFWAVEVGKKANVYLQRGRPLNGFLKFKYNIADKLVYSKLKERVGGRIRFFVSGGAPLSREINEFFNAAGLTLLEGYGLTESSPVIAVNQEGNNKFGSVGLPLKNVEVKIAEDGEILTRGPHVMKGYYKNEEDTKDAIDEEGWLHTGDIGYLDNDGFLYITDRKKNIIVTSGGKNIAPQPIENLLATSPFIEQVIVVGNKRKYCSAIIVPNIDKLKEYAKKNQINYENEDELLKKDEILQFIRKIIDDVSIDLASYETIKKFTLKKEPFTIENGELTPSLKIKRNVVEEKYKEIIDQMYVED